MSRSCSEIHNGDGSDVADGCSCVGIPSCVSAHLDVVLVLSASRYENRQLSPDYDGVSGEKLASFALLPALFIK